MFAITCLIAWWSFQRVVPVLSPSQCEVLLSVSRSCEVWHAFAGLITRVFHSETLWLTISAATVTRKRCCFPQNPSTFQQQSTCATATILPEFKAKLQLAQQTAALFFAGNSREFRAERLCHTKSILTRVRFINSTCNYRQFLVNRAIMKEVYWTEKTDWIGLGKKMTGTLSRINPLEAPKSSDFPSLQTLLSHTVLVSHKGCAFYSSS